MTNPLDSALARICEPGPATKWLMSDHVTNLLAQYRAEDAAEAEDRPRCDEEEGEPCAGS